MFFFPLILLVYSARSSVCIEPTSSTSPCINKTRRIVKLRFADPSLPFSPLYSRNTPEIVKLRISNATKCSAFNISSDINIQQNIWACDCGSTFHWKPGRWNPVTWQIMPNWRLWQVQLFIQVAMQLNRKKKVYGWIYESPLGDRNGLSAAGCRERVIFIMPNWLHFGGCLSVQWFLWLFRNVRWLVSLLPPLAPSFVPV